MSCSKAERSRYAILTTDNHSVCGEKEDGRAAYADKAGQPICILCFLNLGGRLEKWVSARRVRLMMIRQSKPNASPHWRTGFYRKCRRDPVVVSVARWTHME